MLKRTLKTLWERREEFEAVVILFLVSVSGIATMFAIITGSMKIYADPDSGFGAQLFYAGIILMVLTLAGVGAWGFRRMIRVHRGPHK